MLKPLLRTLPTLSGNIKIACHLGDYTNIIGNDFSAYVRIAQLLPLSSNLAQRNIETNLLTSSYDFDVQKFFKYYSATFYDDVFDFDKSNYIVLDKSDSQKNRNTDFEFGCKRVSYQKSEAQYAFYTPIYVESIDDIPDYFLINIELKNEKYSVKKSIRVQISKEDKHNYLKLYIERYLKKLDSNVIFCNVNSKQATYYGIDLVKGGFTKIVDNLIAKAYTRQNTINNFDAIVTNGFQRNNLIIRQILPLCWYFNVNDILSGEEILKFRNAKVYVSGQWYKNGMNLPFYNIDTNYKYYYESPFVINKANGLFVYKSNSNNIMNMEYPSLNEAMYTGYRYTNKLNLKYNRWKLKYSDDEHPYITNLSPAFSINQGSIYKYGGFPEKYKSINLITDAKNNIIIPIGNALTSKDSPYVNDYTLVSNYLTTLNNNVSTWYHLTNNVSDIYNEDIWKDVKDNKVYYKGILYDFSKIYSQYTNLKDKIDKFSVIVNLHFNKLDEEELSKINKAGTSIFNSKKYITDRTAWVSERIPEGLSSGEFSQLPMLYNNASTFAGGNAQLVFDKLYQKSENGDFIDLLSLGYNIYDINKYFKYSDILSVFNYDNDFYENIEEKLMKNANFESYFTEGYELLPIYKLLNVLHENNRDIIFESKEDGKWILDNLYFSQHGNYYKSHYDRDTLIKLIKEYGDTSYMIPLYLKNKFISKAAFIDMLYEIYGSSYTLYNDIINKLTIYEYHPRVKDTTSATYACDVYIKKDNVANDNYGNFIPNSQKDLDNDVLYIDGYNINNVISNYNSKYNRNISLVNTDNTDYRETYAKFLNLKHLLFYCSDIFKNESNEGTIQELVNSLFIKKRVMIGNSVSENLEFKDYYIPFYALYDRYRLLTKDEKISIINGTSTVTGIYLKTDKKYYDNSTYKLISLGTEIENEYHYEDFYYKPELYIRENSAVGVSYITILDYIKKYANIFNSSLLEYINENLIYTLLNNEVTSLSVDDLPFGNGRHQSMRPLGFDTVDLTKENIYDDLIELKSEIIRIFKQVKNSIYYKPYKSSTYIIYDNFTGINDYLILSDNMKVDILNGELNLFTYVIDNFGKFVQKDYDTDEYYTLSSLDDQNVCKYLISSFLTDVKYDDSNNYFTMSEEYNLKHDFDNLIGVIDYDTPLKSKNGFEICYKKTFYKIDNNIYKLINLEREVNTETGKEYPYKDLYIYKLYKADEYPAALKIYFTNNEDSALISEEITNCLIPLFDDILLQDKEYSVIYSEYTQANIYKSTLSTDTRYRYNDSDTVVMYDISNLPWDKEYVSGNNKYYTYTYWNSLSPEDRAGHLCLPTYSLLNNCYSTISKLSDDLNIYDKFSVNTYMFSHYETYTYTYSYTSLETVKTSDTSYTVLVEKEGISSYDYKVNTTYGFILLDAYIDNTNSSFNIVDKHYKKKKYFSYINEHDIYDENYNVLDSFNLLVPFSNINLIDNLFSFNNLIVHPTKCVFNTYYKQNALIDDAGYTYAYDINMRSSRIDTITLQRYFDSIVPYIPEVNMVNSSYCLKYKDYDYVNTNVNYTDDVFYEEDLNIYNYNKLRVYDNTGSYELFEPVEYKHFNSSKLINLPEEFELNEKGTFTYEQLIELEKDDYVLKKFKKYVLESKLNTYNDDEILFLFNRYKVEYDTVCIGLNAVKTQKLYTLTYKFTLL